ncbi:hypothetical protein ACFV9C_34915 [Kribbella sp. NPDC059898]|uniref:hypothetical protein n=1 Tax=Kribbella sp. NPDC059898 TaxID=3346995 RepID=UPI00365CCAFD
MDNSLYNGGGQVGGIARTTATTNAKLVSFLLARIAEDEVDAAKGPETTQAEARARRRLVEIHSHRDSSGETCGDPCYTLRILTARYLTHPDLPIEVSTIDLRTKS